MKRSVVAAVGLVLVAAACGGGKTAAKITTTTPTTIAATSTAPSTTAARPASIYAFTGPADLSPVVANVPPRVYVPNSDANTLTVIDPATKQIIASYPTPKLPNHVVPSWDLKTLYVNNTTGNSLTPIDPVTGVPGEPIPVSDPYNLYFTLDGKEAIVVEERFQKLTFRDPASWQELGSVNVGHSGPNHLDYTADGKTLLIGCEFSGWLVKIDVEGRKVTGELNVGGQPIDIRISPDGSKFYVANQGRNGVSVIDINSMTETKFIPTGKGTHGIYPSRDGTKAYVTNRTGGSVSVLDFATDTITTTWETGSSPDMGGVSTDGTELWLSGRYNAEVIVIDTTSGQVKARIPTGKGAHGLAYFPQPGRFSLGHTGNYR
ncbi:MAG: hypothetical protein ACOYNI_11215 [Acidimicrobiia bacterium]